MIRIRITFINDLIMEDEFETFDSLTFWILDNCSKIRTMEIDVETSNNNRPAFWSKE
jgi:hypothetical protein